MSNNVGSLGGGIYNEGQLKTNDSTIASNTAEARGGGIHNLSGDVGLLNVTANQNNRAHARPDPREPRGRLKGLVRGLDLPGAVSVKAGLLLLVYALSGAESAGFASPRTLGGLVFALILLAAFLLAESRARNPLVPLGIFRSRAPTWERSSLSVPTAPYS